MAVNEFGANSNFDSMKRMIIGWLSMEVEKFCLDT
jgi:hypothetical protein